jgi:Rrf2 family protein
MLSQTNEYALRAAVTLAHHERRSLTTDQLAELTGVPRGYLAKVLQQLRRAGIVSSRRGIRGGFTLARPASELTALSVVNAIDPLPVITSCPLGRAQHRAELCPLHRTLQQAELQLAGTLAGTTLAALSGNPTSPTSPTNPPASPLCEAPEQRDEARTS